MTSNNIINKLMNLKIKDVEDHIDMEIDLDNINKKENNIKIEFENNNNCVNKLNQIEQNKKHDFILTCTHCF